MNVLVTDVNEAPRCPADISIITLSLQAIVGSVVNRLNCYDTDLTDENAMVFYSFENGTSQAIRGEPTKFAFCCFEQVGNSRYTSVSSSKVA